tara:strand:- start:354 stop:464 length:111 start_codon:yes stop_codon:yes gene_type:complete
MILKQFEFDTIDTTSYRGLISNEELYLPHIDPLTVE